MSRRHFSGYEELGVALPVVASSIDGPITVTQAMADSREMLAANTQRPNEPPGSPHPTREVDHDDRQGAERPEEPGGLEAVVLCWQ